MAMSIPTRNDWGNIDQDDLDANWALKNFLGKSSAEAMQLFKENAFFYQEDLQSMAAIPFNFYVDAFVNYIFSEFAKGDSDAASGFLGTIAWILETRPHIISAETFTKLMSTARHISNNQTFYDADVSVYGSFTNRFDEIQKLSQCK